MPPKLRSRPWKAAQYFSDGTGLIAQADPVVVGSGSHVGGSNEKADRNNAMVKLDHSR
eukprot:gene6628-7937_t